MKHPEPCGPTIQDVRLIEHLVWTAPCVQARRFDLRTGPLNLFLLEMREYAEAAGAPTGRWYVVERGFEFHDDSAAPYDSYDAAQAAYNERSEELAHYEAARICRKRATTQTT